MIIQQQYSLIENRSLLPFQTNFQIQRYNFTEVDMQLQKQDTELGKMMEPTLTIDTTIN